MSFSWFLFLPDVFCGCKRQLSLHQASTREDLRMPEGLAANCCAEEYGQPSMLETQLMP